MKQSPIASFVEVTTSTLVGLGVSYVANITVMPWFGFEVTHTQAFLIGVIFTVISVVRSYLWRRAFEYLRVSGILQ